MPGENKATCVRRPGPRERPGSASDTAQARQQDKPPTGQTHHPRGEQGTLVPGQPVGEAVALTHSAYQTCHRSRGRSGERADVARGHRCRSHGQRSGQTVRTSPFTFQWENEWNVGRARPRPLTEDSAGLSSLSTGSLVSPFSKKVSSGRLKEEKWAGRCGRSEKRRPWVNEKLRNEIAFYRSGAR